MTPVFYDGNTGGGPGPIHFKDSAKLPDATASQVAERIGRWLDPKTGAVPATLPFRKWAPLCEGVDATLMTRVPNCRLVIQNARKP
jgi:hypothetical protein